MNLFLLRRCTDVPQHQILNGIKIRAADNGLMVVLDDNPLIPVILHALFDFVVRSAGFVLNQRSDIDFIGQDSLHQHGTPLCLFVAAESAGVVEALCLLVFHGTQDAHAVEPVGNGGIAQSLYAEPEDQLHRAGSFFIHHQPVPVCLVLPVTIGCKGSDEVAHLAFDVQLRANLNGYVAAVGIVDQILEWNDQRIGLRLFAAGIIVVIDGNEPHTHERENLFQIPPCIDVVSGKPAEVFADHTVDFLGLDVLHHLLKARTFKVDAGIAVIRILLDDHKFRMPAHIVPDDFLLARYGIALRLVAVIAGKTGIFCCVPDSVWHFYHLRYHCIEIIRDSR